MKRKGKQDTATDVLDLQRYIPALVSLLENKLSNTASVIYRTAFGIGAAEMRIIVLLGTRSNVSGIQIGQAIGLDKAAVSRSLKSLEGRGLIAIAADVGRRRKVTLTPAGQLMHARGVAISRRREERLLSGFTTEEREALIVSFNRMLKHIPLVTALTGELARNAPRGTKRRPHTSR